MSKFLPKDEILSIKSVDLFTYLKTCFPSELQLFCNGTYTTKTHSSLKISNGLWHYFKEGIGGKNAVDYLVKVENYDFLSACNKVKNDMNLKNNISLEEIEEQELIEGHILKIPKKIIWDDGMIREILRNEIYTGCLVYGKTVNKSYKDRTKIRISRQEWNKVLNCHEAIIERDVWEKVRDKLLSNTNNTRTTGKNLFAKKLYCSCCGRGMQKSKDTRNGQGDYYISCRTVNKVGRFCDNRKQIAKSVLEKIILDKINEQLDKYYDKKIVEDKYNDIKYGNIANQIEKLKMQYNNLEYTLTEKTNRLSILYEDRVNGTLTLEEFKTLKQNIDNEILKYSNERNNIDLQIKELEEQRLKNDFEQNELFEKYRRIEALTPEILNEFVEKIYLGKYNEASNSREIKIIWNIDKKEEIV